MAVHGRGTTIALVIDSEEHDLTPYADQSSMSRVADMLDRYEYLGRNVRRTPGRASGSFSIGGSGGVANEGVIFTHLDRINAAFYDGVTPLIHYRPGGGAVTWAIPVVLVGLDTASPLEGVTAWVASMTFADAPYRLEPEETTGFIVGDSLVGGPDLI